MANAHFQGLIHHLRIAVSAEGTHGVPDAQLLERFVEERDEAAFELLVWRHGKMVLGTCRRLLRDVHEAEDAFQASFLALARRASSISRRESVGGWLYKVAYRIALNVRSRRLKQTTREQGSHNLETVPGAADPGLEASRREIRHLIDEEISQLPERYRVPFVLCYFEGRSNEDVAREFGCPVGTVESRLTRARKRLRAGLSRRGVTLSAGMFAAFLGSGNASASVSTTLVALTAKAAALLIGNHPEAGNLISAPVAALTEGVLQSMLISKLKFVAAVLLALTLAGTGTGILAYRAMAAGQPGVSTEASARVADTETEAERIAKLIEQLASNKFAEREQATKTLDSMGAKALEALRKAAQSEEPERKRRASELVKKIESRSTNAEMLSPTFVQLKYQDTPLFQALADFRKKSGYNILISDPEGALIERKVTLDTGKVTFWKALELFCEKAKLSEAASSMGARPAGGAFAGGGGGGAGGVVVASAPLMPSTYQITLINGKPKQAATDNASSVRIRARAMPDPSIAPAEGEIVIPLEIAAEPKLRWQKTGSIQVRQAIDDQGQKLEQIQRTVEQPAPQGPVIVGQPNIPGAMLKMGGRRQPNPVIFLKKGNTASTKLRELSGTIIAEVLTKPIPFISVEAVMQAAGSSVKGTEGSALEILSVAQEDGQYTLRFQATPPAGAAQPGPRMQFAGAGGAGMILPGFGNLEFQILDATGKMVPVVASQVRGNAGAAAEFTLTCQPEQGQGEPAKLVCSMRKSVTIEVPFTLKDVMLASR